MSERICGATNVNGRVRALRIPDADPAAAYPVTPWKSNLVTNGWGFLVGQLLRLGDLKYRIGGFYLEFKNVDSPGDPVPVPSLDRTRSIDYYAGLNPGDKIDYLRVALTASTIESSDLSLYPDGNLLTFFARSQGTLGVHGLTFSDAENSVVYGASLVAFLDATDISQDKIFSSFYFDENLQQAKLATAQLGLEWALILE